MRFPAAAALGAALLSLSFADIPAPPAIDPDGVWPAAGKAPPSLAGGAVSPGARIVITGVRLGPAQTVSGDEASPPATLAGVRVRIARGAKVEDAGLFSVSERRIEAWIPDSVASGPARMTVTHEGRESYAYELNIETSGFGFFIPEKPPDAAPGGRAALPGSGSATDLDVFVAGKPARAVAVGAPERRRAGVRTVSFEVPRDAPAGCAVPVVARSRSTGRPTNFAALSIHEPGRPCRDAIDWFRRSVEGAENAGFAVMARISVLLGASDEYVFEYGMSSFGRQEAGRRPFPPFPPPGSCAGFTERMNLREVMQHSRTAGAWPEVVKPAPGNRPLDAGPLRFRAAERERLLPRPGLLGGRAPFSHTPPLPLFASPGRLTIASEGGRDIGAFSAEVDVPRALVWRNRAALRAVDRAAGVRVEWRASRKQDAVLIVAASAEHITGDAAMAVCMAPAAAGSFSIPPLALANLPPGDPRKPDYGYLLLLEIPVEPPSPIQASGLDSGFAAFLSASARDVVYR